MNPNLRLCDKHQPVVCLLGTVPSSTTPGYVSLKNFLRATFLVLVKNGTTVTGSAITLKQAKTVAGGSEKALSFAKALRNIDTGASDVLAEFDVSSDTFTTDNTNSKNLLYVIDVPAEHLDIDNGFDCVRVGTGDATAATVTVLAVLHGKQGQYPQPSATSN
jgi:hypothetical protein